MGRAIDMQAAPAATAAAAQRAERIHQRKSLFKLWPVYFWRGDAQLPRTFGSIRLDATAIWQLLSFDQAKPCVAGIQTC